jgi:hypothetical protein
MHGYQHVYSTKFSGLVGINRYSEFAGVPAGEQEEKLRRGLQILRSQGIEPKAWIAPAHSFDEATVKALVQLGINKLSDGFNLFPHTDRHGMLWIPQQLWRFRPLPFGIWTVCLHHNGWSQERIERFELDIARYRNRITTFDEVCRTYATRRQRWIDTVSNASLRAMLTAKLAVERRLLYGSQ